jgi:FSR family fosmidomycin resistance protein-like MFS transporter
MNSRSATLALVFAGVGHFFAHLLMLLYPTVVLVIEGKWGMSYGELLSLSLPALCCSGSAPCRRAGSATDGAPST